MLRPLFFKATADLPEGALLSEVAIGFQMVVDPVFSRMNVQCFTGRFDGRCIELIPAPFIVPFVRPCRERERAQHLGRFFYGRVGMAIGVKHKAIERIGVGVIEPGVGAQVDERGAAA